MQALCVLHCQAKAGTHTWTLKRLDGTSLAVASIFAISTLSLLANASPTCRVKQRKAGHQ